MGIGKSKILYISLVYTAVEWIVALLNRFNSGTNDTYLVNNKNYEGER